MAYNLEKDIDLALKFFPSLNKIKEGRIFTIKGMVPIIDKDGCKRTAYSVSIEFIGGFPFRFPIVREIGNRIPKIPDRHIYTNTGALCLTVPPKEILICKKGITTLRFLNEILIPHLAMQAYREIDDNYPVGEFSHGDAGIIQFFFEMFNTTDKILISRAIELVVFNQHRNTNCFCGSDKKIKHCHIKEFEDLLSIGKDYLKKIKNLFK